MLDDKQEAAILVATLLRMTRDAFVPDRDLIVALTPDEETSSNSIKWLIEKNRPLIDAAFALNLDEGARQVRSERSRSPTSVRGHEPCMPQHPTAHGLGSTSVHRPAWRVDSGTGAGGMPLARVRE